MEKIGQYEKKLKIFLAFPPARGHNVLMNPIRSASLTAFRSYLPLLADYGHNTIHARTFDIVATRRIDADHILHLDWVALKDGRLEPRVRCSVRISEAMWDTEYEVYANEEGLARGVELAAELKSELDALFN